MSANAEILMVFTVEDSVTLCRLLYWTLPYEANAVPGISVTPSATLTSVICEAYCVQSYVVAVGMSAVNVSTPSLSVQPLPLISSA